MNKLLIMEYFVYRTEHVTQYKSVDACVVIVRQRKKIKINVTTIVKHKELLQISISDRSSEVFKKKTKVHN